MVLKDEIQQWQSLRSKDLNNNQWLEFQQQVFPHKRINLNPSTFGSPSIYCQKSFHNLFQDKLESYPLGLYQKGRDEIKYSRSLATFLWGSTTHNLSISQSSSQTQNLLMLNLLLLLYQKGKKAPFRVLTTINEHIGGIGFFINKKEIKLEYLSEDEIKNLANMQKRIKQIKPDIFFASHLTYDMAREFPVNAWAATIKQVIPECIVVIDYAQSLGLLPIQLVKEIDLAFASSHKWLMGPYGLGFIWISHTMFSKLERIQWNGEVLDSEWVGSGFEMTGGQSFGLYASLSASLLLYSSIGIKIILQRSNFLLNYFINLLHQIFTQYKIDVKYSSRKGFLKSNQFSEVGQCAGYCSIHFQKIDPYSLYNYLNQKLVHVKCIKKNNNNILRIGIPYYENKERLKNVAHLIDFFFAKQK